VNSADGPRVAIAVCNDMLPDGDPGKITQHTIARLRAAASIAGNLTPCARELHALADALARYLPPPDLAR
jgi:hypothetical protein